MDFETFLLRLNCFSDFHLAVFGPDCDPHLKTSKVITNRIIFRQMIARSPIFMTNNTPSIMWKIAAQELYAEDATATKFNRARVSSSKAKSVSKAGTSPEHTQSARARWVQVLARNPRAHTNPNFNPAFQAQLNLHPPGETREKVRLCSLLQKCPLGSCDLFSACTKTHAPLTFPPGGAKAVYTMLQPGFDALLASS